MAREEVDLIVQIPLEEEYLQFTSIFPTKENKTEGVNATYLVDAPSNLRVLVTLQEKMGRAAAISACMAALERFSTKLYACLGIAGGLSKDLKLGDVCYTGTLIDVLDNSKITDSVDGGLDVAFAPEFYETDRRITAAIGFHSDVDRTPTELLAVAAKSRVGRRPPSPRASAGPQWSRRTRFAEGTQWGHRVWFGSAE